MIEAVPDSGRGMKTISPPEDVNLLHRLTADFSARCREIRQEWRERLGEFRHAGSRVVVWGSSSKGVAFLTVLGARDSVDYVVDINPNRQGHFMAGTGQMVVGPDFLSERPPDAVVVMNSIYRDEIADELARRGLEPQLLCL